ncbi:L-rhamnose operon transcriptional activator rhaR [Chryseobacterium nakagawai]|nr:helix-turn-helix domain-containing protein [Chryseobacterium nakagawai]VEH19578.1 L-rhamnose operon transcriptional activator rhaR [Chryseobacterium nakagawai]
MDKIERMELYTIETLVPSSSSLSDFAIYTLQDFSKQFKHLKDPHRHDFYSMIIFEKGQGEHVIDFVHYDIKANRIFLINYGQVHAWIKLKDVKGYIINFTKEFYNLIYTGNNKIKSDLINSEITPYIDIDQKTMCEWNQLAELIKNEYQAEKREFKELICIYLKAILIKYRRHHRCSLEGTINKSDRKTVLIQQFNELVNVKFKQWKFPRQYADELHITSNYLNIIVKKSLGWSAGYIIRERIVLEAKRLLQSTDLTVAEIGTELGFTDKSNFNKYFKGYVHTTPENYRKQTFQQKN